LPKELDMLAAERVEVRVLGQKRIFMRDGCAWEFLRGGGRPVQYKKEVLFAEV